MEIVLCPARGTLTWRLQVLMAWVHTEPVQACSILNRFLSLHRIEFLIRNAKAFGDTWRNASVKSPFLPNADEFSLILSSFLGLPSNQSLLGTKSCLLPTFLLLQNPTVWEGEEQSLNSLMGTWPHKLGLKELKLINKLLNGNNSKVTISGLGEGQENMKMVLS